jgi:hypothetical protein
MLTLPLTLALWGCNSEQIESGANSTATGLSKAGGAIESGSKNLGDKLKESGSGTKLEGAAASTGRVIEQGGEKTREVLDKAGDKLKEAAPAAGKAIDKAGDKLKEVGQKTSSELKELKEKAGEAVDKAGDKLKQLGDKTKELLNKEGGKE